MTDGAIALEYEPAEFDRSRIRTARVGFIRCPQAHSHENNGANR
jgi:hypothetical protein